MFRAPTEETDNLTFQTQQLAAFTASQEKELSPMRKRLTDCMRSNSNTPPPTVIDTANKN